MSYADEGNLFMSYTRDVGAFFGVLGQKLRSHRQGVVQLDRYLSKRFNVVSIIDPNENDLSDLIAMLLDPRGNHGQGGAFLELFLERLKLPEVFDRTLVSINREHVTTHLTHARRFVDLVLEFRDYALAIENKPWAAEQVAQLEDYHAHLNVRYGGKFCLIYLTADGRPPHSMNGEMVEAELRSGRLVLWSFQTDTTGWLDECIKVCESEKFRWFLRDLSEFIRTRFPAPPESEVRS